SAASVAGAGRIRRYLRPTSPENAADDPAAPHRRRPRPAGPSRPRGGRRPPSAPVARRPPTGPRAVGRRGPAQRGRSLPLLEPGGDRRGSRCPPAPAARGHREPGARCQHRLGGAHGHCLRGAGLPHRRPTSLEPARSDGHRPLPARDPPSRDRAPDRLGAAGAATAGGHRPGARRAAPRTRRPSPSVRAGGGPGGPRGEREDLRGRRSGGGHQPVRLHPLDQRGSRRGDRDAQLDRPARRHPSRPPALSAAAALPSVSPSRSRPRLRSPGAPGPPASARGRCRDLLRAASSALWNNGHGRATNRGASCTAGRLRLSSAKENANMAVATPDQYAEMIDRAKAGKFAYPAVNVSSSQTAIAALQGFTEANSDGIIQVSFGGAEYLSGSTVKDRVA